MAFDASALYYRTVVAGSQATTGGGASSYVRCATAAVSSANNNFLAAKAPSPPPRHHDEKIGDMATRSVRPPIVQLAANGGRPECTFNLILIGDSGVGKTSLVNRYTTEGFAQALDATIGLEFRVKVIQVADRTVRLQIWDTAGQERFRALTKQYFRQADAILVVYDVTNRQTYEHVGQWLNEAVENGRQNAIRYLIGNKSDAQVNRSVHPPRFNVISENGYSGHFETSARNGDQVALLFSEVAERLIQIAEEEEKLLYKGRSPHYNPYHPNCSTSVHLGYNTPDQFSQSCCQGGRAGGDTCWRRSPLLVDSSGPSSPIKTKSVD